MSRNTIDLSHEASPVPDRPIAAAKAWQGKDLTTSDWLISLSSDCLEEIDQLVKFLLTLRSAPHGQHFEER